MFRNWSGIFTYQRGSKDYYQKIKYSSQENKNNQHFKILDTKMQPDVTNTQSNAMKLSQSIQSNSSELEKEFQKEIYKASETPKSQDKRKKKILSQISMQYVKEFEQSLHNSYDEPVTSRLVSPTKSQISTQSQTMMKYTPQKKKDVMELLKNSDKERGLLKSQNIHRFQGKTTRQLIQENVRQGRDEI